jgi:hypothetical protein
VEPLPCLKNLTEKKKPSNEDVPPDTSDRYTYKEWMSLFDKLCKVTDFKTRVKSSPGDDLKRVYAIEGFVKDSHSINEWVNRILFTVTETSVHVEIMSHGDELIDNFSKCLLEHDLELMPLYVNDKSHLIREVVKWRLENGI